MKPTVPTLKNLGLRDVAHFAVAFAGSFFVSFQAAGQVWTWSLAYSLIPGAAAVGFRQIFPNSNLTAPELTGAVTHLQTLAAKLEHNPVSAVTDPTVDSVTALVTGLVEKQSAAATQAMATRLAATLGIPASAVPEVVPPAA